MIDVMLDLETLSSKPNAAVVSIGAVAFNKDGVAREGFYEVLDVEDQELKGRHISASTFKWWTQQSEQARKVFAETPSKTPMALARFEAYLYGLTSDVHARRIWGYGSTFDNVVLRSLYESYGMKAPWTYRGDMCYRTLKGLFPKVAIPERTGTHHNALDDARYQAQCAVIYLNKLGG